MSYFVIFSFSQSVSHFVGAFLLFKIHMRQLPHHVRSCDFTQKLQLAHILTLEKSQLDAPVSIHPTNREKAAERKVILGNEGNLKKEDNLNNKDTFHKEAITKMKTTSNI